MITSYGSDESDSDTTDDNQLKNNTSSIIESKNIDSVVKLRYNEKYSLPLPLMQSQLISQNTNHKYEEKDNVEESGRELLDLKSIEGTEMKYLKNQQNVAQRLNECVDKPNDNRFITKSITKKNNSKHNVNSDVDFRISLVPGYDEDSDVEEEIKQEKKALFPIPQIDEITENVSSYKITLDDDQIVNNNDDINIERKNVLEQNNEDILEKLECRDDSGTKSEEDIQKGNKFIDNLHRNKYFQRKKRIAFDGKNIL